MTSEQTQIYNPLVKAQLNTPEGSDDPMVVVTLKGEDGTECEVVFPELMTLKGVINLLDQFFEYFVRAEHFGYELIRDEINRASKTLDVDEIETYLAIESEKE